MSRITQRNIALVCALALVVLAVGCTSEERFYQEVRMSRSDAYKQWKSRRQLEEKSQAYIKGRLSLSDALKLAMVNNKSLQRFLEEKDIARGELVKSYSAILPSVELNAEYTRLDEVSSFDISGTAVKLGDLDNYSVNLEVTQPVFAGGSIPAKINMGKLFKLLTDQTIQRAVQEVIFEVGRGYYDVLLNQHLYEISADAVRSARVNLDAVEQRRAVGVASNFDVLRAEVELSNFKAELIKNRNAVNLSKTALLKAMGVSQDSDVTLSDRLVFEAFETKMQEAVKLAFENRPLLYQRRLEKKTQEESLRIARSRYWPSVSAFYRNQWAKPDPKSSTKIEWGRAWRAGVVARLPIFDGLNREGQIIQEKARLRQAQIDVIDSEETVLFEVTRAILSIQDAEEFVESQRLNLARAEEGLRLAEVGYKEGVNTQVEVLDARAALTRARSLYYEAIHSHNIAKLFFRRATGTLVVPASAAGEVKAKQRRRGELSLMAERKGTEGKQK